MTSKFDVEQSKSERKLSVREWTSVDELTHDFADSESFRKKCLEKYGQYMGRDGIRVVAH